MLTIYLAALAGFTIGFLTGRLDRKVNGEPFRSPSEALKWLADREDRS